MARTPSEQRRDAANRNTPSDQGPQDRRAARPGAKSPGKAGQSRPQQPRSGRDRPFAPGEDGESH